MKVLFVSGYGGDRARLGRALEADAMLLPKPFTPDQLERAVATVVTASE